MQTTALSLLGSRMMQMPTFVVIGNPGSRRVSLFQAALAERDLPPARLVAYADLMAGRVSLPDVVPGGAVVRIESPGKDTEVERALLALGAEMPDIGDYARLPREQVEQMVFERGEIICPRQWYLGFCGVLDRITAQLARCSPHYLMNDPAEIALMFDKPACHTHLVDHQIPVAPALGAVHSFNELIERMQQSRCSRVFVKLAHGSSASGVVAYQFSGNRHQVTTTVEMVRENGTLRLFNSRRLRVYRDVHEIATLINALCQHHVHVERWLPKAGFCQQSFDLRIVVIAGQVQHTVVRLSRSPMTNLHLLNQRGDLSALLAEMGTTAWDAIRHTSEHAMDCFPRSLYAGLDLLVRPGYERHAVLEMNAFGDLLPDVLFDGKDTYGAEIDAVLSRVARKAVWNDNAECA
ncbi:MAG: STM4014 family protein [Chloroflexota bacterium]